MKLDTEVRENRNKKENNPKLESFVTNRKSTSHLRRKKRVLFVLIDKICSHKLNKYKQTTVNKKKRFAECSNANYNLVKNVSR